MKKLFPREVYRRLAGRIDVAESGNKSSDEKIEIIGGADCDLAAGPGHVEIEITPADRTHCNDRKDCRLGVPL